MKEQRPSSAPSRREGVGRGASKPAREPRNLSNTGGHMFRITEWNMDGRVSASGRPGVVADPGARRAQADPMHCEADIKRHVRIAIRSRSAIPLTGSSRGDRPTGSSKSAGRDRLFWVCE